MLDRYDIYKDFNTKDYYIYDNETDQNICRCDTEKECYEYIERILSAEK